MSSELIQCILLTSHGNAYLHDARRVSREMAENVAFESDRSVQFGLATPADGLVACRKWFQRLKRGSVARLWLTDSLADAGDEHAHIVEAFSNGSPRGIITESQNGDTEMWVPEWKFSRGAKWKVTYNCYQAPPLPRPEKLGPIKKRLTIAVKRAMEFNTNDTEYWADSFSKSLDALESGRGYSRLFPSFGYSVLSRQLIAGAQYAWVFGGMGTWNDQGFENPERQRVYLEVTRELHTAVCSAIVASTNAFDAESRP